MVVRFDRGDKRFSWMSDAQRDVRPLPAAPEAKDAREQYETLQAAIPDIAKKYVRAIRTEHMEAKVLFAEGHDKILRLFLKTGYRDLTGIHRWFRELSRAVDEGVQQLFAKEKGHVPEEVRRAAYEKMKIHSDGWERSIVDMVRTVDRLRAEYPEDLLFTSPGIDVQCGVDLLRAKNFTWDAEASVLEMDLVAYQAKAGNSTARERAQIAKDYGKNFAEFERIARTDANRLAEVAHVPETDLSSLSADDLLEVAVQGQEHLAVLEQNPSTSPLTDLQKFARRLRWVDRANVMSVSLGGIQLMAPAARIRFVESRFVGRDERGMPVDASFEEILATPLPEEQMWIDRERAERKKSFLRDIGDQEAI